MGLNLEIKIKAKLNQNLIHLISELNGRHVETLFQKDTYYKYLYGALKLREQNGEFSLIKYYRDEKNPDRWSNYAILEISGENVEEYLRDILDVEVTVEKKRELYLYKNTRIHLDRVNNLGEFLELETVSDDLSESEAKEEFEYVLQALKLDKEEEIRSSYKDLIINY